MKREFKKGDLVRANKYGSKWLYSEEQSSNLIILRILNHRLEPIEVYIQGSGSRVRLRESEIEHI